MRVTRIISAVGLFTFTHPNLIRAAAILIVTAVFALGVIGAIAMATNLSALFAGVAFALIAWLAITKPRIRNG